MARLGRARRAASRPADNAALMREILALRAERARLLGHADLAEFRLADTMAQAPRRGGGAAARAPGSRRSSAPRRNGRSWRRWPAPQGHNGADRGLGLALLGGARAQAQARFRRRRAEAAFRAGGDAARAASPPRSGCSACLRGTAATSPSTTPMSAPSRRRTRTGAHRGVFLLDNFARIGKRSGAWMSSYRVAEALDGARVSPIIVNNNNLAKADADAAVLGRCAHAVPRIRPCAARAAEHRALPVAVRHRGARRLRRIPLPGAGALARRAGDAARACPPPRDRRAPAGGAAGQAAGGAQRGPGLRDGGVSSPPR